MTHPFLKSTLLLAVIALIALGLIAVSVPAAEDRDAFTVAAGFYPVYVAVLNVAGEVPGVKAVNLAGSLRGCAHDYQMSPSDREKLNEADIVVKNGAGAEPFLDQGNFKKPVVDLSRGQELLPALNTDEAEYNAHFWVSPVRYRAQILALRDGLAEADPAHAEQYRENADGYLEKIDAIGARLQRASGLLSGREIAVFHDSLAYLAQDLSLPVICSLGLGEESGVSAYTLRRAENALKGKDAVFLTDAQYTDLPYRYLQSIPKRCAVISADTCVSPGNGPDKDRWIEAMNALCAGLEEAAK